MTRDEWLQQCFKTWTTSNVQSEAWKYRNDYEGFCRWFLGVGGVALYLRNTTP